MTPGSPALGLLDGVGLSKVERSFLELEEVDPAEEVVDWFERGLAVLAPPPIELWRWIVAGAYRRPGQRRKLRRVRVVLVDEDGFLVAPDAISSGLAVAVALLGTSGGVAIEIDNLKLNRNLKEETQVG